MLAPPSLTPHHTHIAGGSDGRNSVSPQRRQRSDHLEKPGSLMRASGKGVCSHDRLLFAVYFGSLCLFATAVTSLLRPFFVSFPPCFSLCLFIRPFCLLIAFLFFDVFLNATQLYLHGDFGTTKRPKLLHRAGLFICPTFGSVRPSEALEPCSSASHNPPRAPRALLLLRGENNVRWLRASRACVRCSV